MTSASASAAASAFNVGDISYITTTIGGATEIFITAADGTEYRIRAKHTEMEAEHGILRAPGAAAALFAKRADIIAADQKGAHIVWGIDCPLTGRHHITIVAPVSRHPDRIDQLRGELINAVAMLRVDSSAGKHAILSVAEDLIILSRDIHAWRDESITKKILDYFDADIHDAYICGGRGIIGAAHRVPGFMSDSKHWIHRHLAAGLSLMEEHEELIEPRMNRIIPQSGYDRLKKAPLTAFGYMLVKLSPPVFGIYSAAHWKRIAAFLDMILPHIIIKDRACAVHVGAIMFEGKALADYIFNFGCKVQTAAADAT